MTDIIPLVLFSIAWLGIPAITVGVIWSGERHRKALEEIHKDKRDE